MKVDGLIPALALAATLAWTNTTRAECTNVYTPQQLTEDLGAMTTALRALDEVTFKNTGVRMKEMLPCIRKKLPPAVYANMYRYIGAYYYLSNNYQEAGRWFRTALELDPNFEWDINDLGPGHPLRGNFDSQRQTADIDPEALQGMVLNVPSGSELYLDGRKITEPEATMGRPHLLQVVSLSDNSVRQSFVIEGNAIPEVFLQPEEAVVTTAPETSSSRRNRGEELGEEIIDGFRVVTVQRVRPPAKTPLMLAGGVGVLLGGGLYALSYQTNQDFYAATTTDELLRQQSLTNALVIASGAVAAVGVGVGYAGVMMDGGPGVFVGRRF